MEDNSETPQRALHFESSIDMIMFSVGMCFFSASFLLILYWLIKNRDLLAMMAQPIFSIDPKKKSSCANQGECNGSEFCPDELELKSNSSDSSSLASVHIRAGGIVTYTTTV